MNYRKISQLERSFTTSPMYKINKKMIGFGHNEVLELYECEPKFKPLNYFFQEEFAKKRIVLHFTAGQLQGDIATLTGGAGRVSVPFVIARDGKIYRLFSSKFWSYHLGPSALGGNTSQSRQTIGIELSNFGPLSLFENKLYCWTNNAYCSISETRQFVKLNQAFRKQHYFATFTNAQYQSLKTLLRYLCQTYQIPPVFLPKELRFQTTPNVLDFEGIVSHINYRSDKVDIGPAFDWNTLANTINEPQVPLSLPEGDAITEAQLDFGKKFPPMEEEVAGLEGLGF